MICFHFIIFEPSETTHVFGLYNPMLLWFAFISLSLSHQKQLIGKKRIATMRCDLLSFHYLWAIRNNYFRALESDLPVVICFHFIIFEPSETTLFVGQANHRMLWFAFISLSLSHQKQLSRPQYVNERCCDLLSFHYLWAIRNNLKPSTNLSR